MRSTPWVTAALATRHCLAGCAAGEVAGMVLAAAFSWGNGVTIMVSLVLAFVLGDALSLGIAFLVAWPVNRWLISRGRGHAVVHRIHEVA